MKEKKTADPANDTTKSDAGTLAARALIFLVAACSAVGAVLCFRTGFAVETLGVKIVWIVGGSLAGVFSCLSWIVFIAALNVERHNFFLYDRGTKTEIPLEELTWERIDERLAGAFAYYFRNRRRLSTMPEVLHPLFLPFYLLQFREAPDADADRLLKNKEMIDSTVRALSELDLGDDGRQLLYHFGAYEGDPVPFRAFVDSAEPRIKKQITEYIKTHIDEFV